MAAPRLWRAKISVESERRNTLRYCALRLCIACATFVMAGLVLAGHIASPESWTNFSKDWDELLPFAPLDKNGRRNFKMSEMLLTLERRQNLVAFYRVIEKYVLCSFSFHFRIRDLEAAKARVH